MTCLSRRSLLTAGGALLAGLTLPRISLARAATDKRFVLVILRGGLDGLAAVPPLGDPAYGTARGALALEPEDVDLALDSTFSLHPGLEALAPFWAQGELAVFHAIGLDYGGRSHFDAQNILETGGQRAGALHDGWLNRALGVFEGASGGQSGSDHPAGLAVAPALPLALQGDVPVSASAPSALPAADEDLLNRTLSLLSGDPLLGPALERALALEAAASGMAGQGGDSKAMARRASRGNELAPFTTGLGNLLKAPDGPRIAVTEMGGWDTHAGQGTTQGVLDRRLKALAEGLVALRQSLGPVWSQTVVLVVTEFGRTVAPNGSKGTDHGTGGVAFALGGGVKGGQVLTDWPGLGTAQLHQGRDLATTSSLVSVFKGVLEGHLQLSSRSVNQHVLPDFGTQRSEMAFLRG